MKKTITLALAALSFTTLASVDYVDYKCELMKTNGDNLPEIIEMKKDSTKDYNIMEASVDGNIFRTALLRKASGPQAQFNYKNESKDIEVHSMIDFDADQFAINGLTYSIDNVGYSVSCSKKIMPNIDDLDW